MNGKLLAGVLSCLVMAGCATPGSQGCVLVRGADGSLECQAGYHLCQCKDYARCCTKNQVCKCVDNTATCE